MPPLQGSVMLLPPLDSRASQPGLRISRPVGAQCGPAGSGGCWVLGVRTDNRACRMERRCWVLGVRTKDAACRIGRVLARKAPCAVCTGATDHNMSRRWRAKSISECGPRLTEGIAVSDFSVVGLRFAVYEARARLRNDGLAAEIRLWSCHLRFCDLWAISFAMTAGIVEERIERQDTP